MKVITEEVMGTYLSNFNNDFRRVRLELQISEYEKSDYIPIERLLYISGDYGLSLVRLHLEKSLSFKDMGAKLGLQSKLLEKYCKEKFSDSVLQAHKQRVEKKELEELSKKVGRSRTLKSNEIPLHFDSNVRTRRPNTVIKSLDEVREVVKPLLSYGITVTGICRNFGIVECDKAKLKIPKPKIDVELADKIWSSLYKQVYNDPYFLYETLDRYNKFSLSEEVRKHLHYCIKDRNKNINLYVRGKTVVRSKNKRLMDKKPVIV
ncbi:hypothetical protein P4493_05170 [Bacillus thuringiensis]|jgi:hypothetical protein|uniref:Uncharacterized protein n=3 Tax=Bacillus thuringiensis TaxID=1428 RepID=A0A0B5NKS5_BACTU|nr:MULTISPECIES: hypothetical protein [Bacillus]EAO56422.1 hypothetical protein RBTH_07470 [Bacillus thuringiensis serovar israelensis ATCC 35646]MEC2536144.1 hypothetical protein [Bacillus cereus]MED1153614.1 hypothetical protein [Bacillus paranthracis]OUB09496.1 hypothetical protein BK708_33835 [Bacillus thuringiensis serovar yunnanensis]AFQ29940.1 hypothetical protein BTF1_29197 [Bacillus thuringiensis HD-789]